MPTSSRLSVLRLPRLDNNMTPDMAVLAEKRIALCGEYGDTLMPVAQRLTTLHVGDESIDIPYDGGLLRCESEFRRHVKHCLCPFPVTRAIAARGEPPRRSPQAYSMRGVLTPSWHTVSAGTREKLRGSWPAGERGAVKLAPLRQCSRGGVDP